LMFWLLSNSFSVATLNGVALELVTLHFGAVHLFYI
jgi:hypothetical protein